MSRSSDIVSYNFARWDLFPIAIKIKLLSFDNPTFFMALLI